MIELEKLANEKSAQKLHAMFPNLSEEEIRETVGFYFPDEVAAIKELAPLSAQKKQDVAMEGALDEALKSMEETKRRIQEFKQQVAEIHQSRDKRAGEIASLPPGESRAFLETVDGMKNQKDEAWIQETGKRLNAQLRECEENLQKVKSSFQQGDPNADPKVLRDQWSKQQKAREDKLKEFEDRLEAKKKERKVDNSSLQEAKESDVAQMMHQKLGEEKFARLQEGRLSFFTTQPFFQFF